MQDLTSKAIDLGGISLATQFLTIFPLVPRSCLPFVSQGIECNLQLNVQTSISLSLLTPTVQFGLKHYNYSYRMEMMIPNYHHK